MHMKFPGYFADAEAPFNEASFVIYGVPYDQTSSFRRGAATAPKAIREASWNFEPFDIRTGSDLSRIPFHDYGDLKVVQSVPQEMIHRVRMFTGKLLEKNKFPIVMGGEHSLTSGVIQAFPPDIAVLALDAHFDFRDTYENESYNHACVIRRITDHIAINNIAVLGVRSAEKEEYDHAQQKGLRAIDAFTIHEQGIESTLKEIKKCLKNHRIYLTLDIDVIDPAYVPGTSTPEPFGLSPVDILACIDQFSSQLIGFDVVEVCPPYDHGETALLAAKLIRVVIGSVWKTQHG